MPSTRSRRLLPALAIAALTVLAGCLGPDSPTPASESAPSPVVVTRPDDYSSLENMSTPAGERWHVHDYWGGQGRLAVLDDSAEGQWNCGGCETGVMIRMRPEPKHVVPLGTSALEVTATWTEKGSSHGEPELWVKSAEMDEPEKATPIQSGVPVTVPSTNDKNDPPHQVLSLWEFWVVFPTVGDGAVFEGKVALKVEAIRGLDIPPFPPHPDLWNGATEITLFDETEGPFYRTETENSINCMGGCTRIHSPVDGVIVPYDASEVVVTMRYVAGIPATLALSAHGADSWDLAPVKGDAAEPGVVVYHIPVSPANGDSPYAKQSLWEFQLFLDQPTPVRAWAGEYALSAKAFKG